jgi:hypothetical protein
VVCLLAHLFSGFLRFGYHRRWKWLRM